MTVDVQELLDLAALTMRFGEVERATRHPDGRPETDTTHTVMLGLVALRVMGSAPEPLNLALVLYFSLIHDLVEAYAGDVSTLRPLDGVEAANKEERERAACVRIDRAHPWLGAAIDHYRRQDTAEARFVRYLDKVLPKLTHALNGCAAAKGASMPLVELRERHQAQGDHLDEVYPELIWLRPWFDAAAKVAEKAYNS